MLPDVDQIRTIRKSRSISQKELAASVGVSQSMIAKIESKRISPSYGVIKKIFNFFEKIQSENQVKAKDVMNKKIIKVGKNDKMSMAVKKMKKHGYSQLPVFSGSHSIGSITEATIVDLISSGQSLDEIMKKNIGELMDESFPVLTEDTPISSVSELLQHSSAVIVNKKGKTSGIITKSDLLKIR